MLCTIVVLVLLAFIGYQNYAPIKGWIQTVIARARGQEPPAPPA